MTIDEVKKLKRQAELAVRDILRHFQTDTGTEVKNIELVKEVSTKYAMPYIADIGVTAEVR